MLEKIKSDLYSAQKAKDTLRVSVLRFLIAAVQNKEIELRADTSASVQMSEDDIQRIIKKQIKQLNQTIENYVQAGRESETAKAKSEIAILQSYLIEEA